MFLFLFTSPLYLCCYSGLNGLHFAMAVIFLPVASLVLDFRLIFAEQVLALSLDVGRQKPCLHFRHTELSTSIDIN